MKKLALQELNRMDIESFKQSEKLQVCVILDNVRSANNVGSAFRTCDAFSVETLYLCGYTPQPPHKDIQKTAIGATESMQWIYFEKIEDCLEKLKNEGFKLIAIEQAEPSVKLNKMKWNKHKKYALIFGNEVSGVSELAIEKVDYCLEVPQFGTKHSLNISVCAGVVLWDAVRQLKF
jgi:23S rRNA (guanosine2251-2'-O)-methyltransferase